MIPVTKPFLPSLEDYGRYVADIWNRNWLTNNGPLTRQLEKKLQEFLGTPHLAYCSNGTIALQIAIKALGIEGEIITTPFSYVASVNSILWESCTPVFADIRQDDFCINADLIEEKITKKTKAILAVHVYGLPCDVVRIKQIANKHSLKVIYDGAHAFGVEMNGSALLNCGDISTCSFHATKLYHTIEGGAIICNSRQVFDTVIQYRQFGHAGDEYYSMGINAKNSEFHAAMGLCNLPHVAEIIQRRKDLSELYDQHLRLGSKLTKPQSGQIIKYNYAYYIVAFPSEAKLLQALQLLKENNVYPRRYFYPALHTLPFLKSQSCPVAESFSKRVLALPLFYELDDQAVRDISRLINSVL